MTEQRDQGCILPPSRMRIETWVTNYTRATARGCILPPSRMRIETGVFSMALSIVTPLHPASEQDED